MKKVNVFTNNDSYISELVNGFQTFTGAGKTVEVEQVIINKDLTYLSVEENDNEILFILSPTYFSLSSMFLLSDLIHRYSNRLTVLYKVRELIGTDEIAFTREQHSEILKILSSKPFESIVMFIGETSSCFTELYLKVTNEKFNNIEYNVGGFKFNKGSILALRDWVEKAEKDLESSFDTKDLILKALLIINERSSN